jgi:hypothetical protein
MTRGDAQKGDRCPLGLAPPLFPVAQRVHADAHGACKLSLSATGRRSDAARRNRRQARILAACAAPAAVQLIVAENVDAPVVAKLEVAGPGADALSLNARSLARADLTAPAAVAGVA